jgi:UDP-N-acetylglucosamine 2-epimerase (non-hydrolysing)
MRKVLTVFGTRPEVIKLGPVIVELSELAPRVRTINVASGQHRELARPFIDAFGLEVTHDLAVMRPDQTPAKTCSRILEALEPVLLDEQPDLVLVQGDTTTALAGALAAFYQRIPVGHIEAGLRSGDVRSPFPEEMNRRMITRLASYHFAATAGNRATLLAEGVPDSQIFVTGNPVVQALHLLRLRSAPSPEVTALLDALAAWKCIVLTTHRRESFGPRLEANLLAVRGFVEDHADVALLFPVHVNPRVAIPARRILQGHPRIRLMEPVGYADFLAMLSRAWLVVSDSGGVQEEAPSLGKPVLVLRENTERPEAVTAGVARLTGGDPDTLARMLAEAYRDDRWAESVRGIENPFGDVHSGRRIAVIVGQILAARERRAAQGGPPIAQVERVEP